MLSRIKDAGNRLARLEGVAATKASDLQKMQAQFREIEAALEAAQTAQQIAQLVAKETQSQIICHIEDIVTLALQAVFGDGAYSFEIEFVERRGKTEADLFFVRNGLRIRPMDAAGGGAVDVVSFALRVALWSLLRSTGSDVNNTIILDEPFRFLSVNLQPLAGEMVKMLSDRLGIQFIIVTHIQDLADKADRVFRVSNSSGDAVVAQIGGENEK